jgi:predicted nucleic acid-binding Zn ribbon protein
MAGRKLSRVGDDLKRILRALEIEGPAREAVAVASWAGVVGERIAAATRAERIQGGVLDVRTRSSGWTQELTFHKQTILRRLNEAAGGEVVSDLRFRTGELPVPGEPSGVGSGAEAVPREALAAIPLPEPVAREIEQASRHPDPELAALIRRVLTHEWQLDEWRRLQGYRPCSRCGARCAPPRTVCSACAAERNGR